MKMQVYLALYGIVDKEYRFLIAKKNKKAHFYGRKKFPNGIDIKNGPCSWVFPGGKARPGKKPLCEAYREFKEETGIDKVVIEKGEVIGIGNQQYKVFFVCCSNLQDIVTKIKNNLGNSEFVKDDELYIALLATRQEALHYFQSTEEHSSWFIDALNYFYNHHLGGSNAKAIWEINDFPDSFEV